MGKPKNAKKPPKVKYWCRKCRKRPVSIKHGLCVICR